MRLELPCIFSLNGFQLVIGLYRGHPLFFLECIYFNLLYSSLIFDIWYIFLLCECVKKLTLKNYIQAYNMTQWH